MIYLDYAASTPVDPEIFQEYYGVLTKSWANPSSVHSMGRQANAVIENARALVAATLEVKRNEIIFTSSATESNNTILNTFLEGDSLIITSVAEHSSISSIIKHHSGKGAIQTLSIDPDGFIRSEELEPIVTAHPDKRILVSIHLVQSEIGTIQNLNQIASIIKQLNTSRDNKVYLHTDATQAPLFLSLQPAQLGVDYMTLSSHKLYAPRGAAMMYIRTNSPIRPLYFGGNQESSLRPGTQNTAGIHALSKSLFKAQNEHSRSRTHYSQLRDELAKKLTSQLPITINGFYEPGDTERRSANNLHFTLPGCDQESALFLYDQQHICVSTGSACTSGSVEVPEVLGHIGSPQGAHIRVSLGRYTSEEEIIQFSDATVEIFSKLHTS